VARPAIRIDISIRKLAGGWSEALPPYRARIRRWCLESLPQEPKGEPKGEPKSLAVMLADDAYVQTLNRRFRGKDKPTNILSFPDAPSANASSANSWGGLALAFETILREAGEQGKTFEAHLAHLVIHGCLHLMGYDHERADERDAMEAQEINLLARFGIDNPYEPAS
jgi:probable rRNA maturation factor